MSNLKAIWEERFGFSRGFCQPIFLLLIARFDQNHNTASSTPVFGSPRTHRGVIVQDVQVEMEV